MNRRSFLKVLGAAGGAAFLGLSLPWEDVAARSAGVDFGGLRYRGDRHGLLYVSADGGATWSVHTKLGEMYRVKRLRVNRLRQLQATIGYRGRSFRLVLAPDAKAWLTA